MKKKIPILIAVMLGVMQLFPMMSYAGSKSDIQKHLGSIVWSDYTLNKLSAGATYEISQKYSSYKFSKIGSFDVTDSTPIYFTAGSLSGNSSWMDDPTACPFSKSIYAITLPSLNYGSGQHFIGVKYNSAKSLVGSEEYKSIDDALKKFNEEFSKNKTDANLKKLADKYIAPYTFCAETINRCTLNGLKGSYGTSTKDSTTSGQYRVISATEYVVVGNTVKSNMGEYFNSDTLSYCTFKTPFVAIKIPAYSDEWLLCDYTTDFSKASSDVAVSTALEELNKCFDVEEEDTPEMDIGDIDVEEGAGEEIVGYAEEEVADTDYSTSGKASFRKMKKDPLDYINEFSFADTNSPGEKELKGIASSAYDFGVTLAVIGYTISVISGLIGLWFKGYKVKNQFFDMLLSKTFMIVILGGFSGIIGTVISVLEIIK